MQVGDTVVEETGWYRSRYSFYRIKRQTPKTVILEQLKEVCERDYPLTGTPRMEYKHINLTNEVIGSYRVKKRLC